MKMQQSVLMLGILFGGFFLSCADSGNGGTGGGGSVGSSCELTFECGPGLICSERRCVAPTITEPDIGDDGEVGEDSTDDAEVDGEADAPVDGDDGGETDGASDAPTDVEERVTFVADRYRRCTDDLECAVFGGNCLIELPLSRPDTDGTERVAVSELDPSFAEGEGICSLSCTNDPRVCSTVTVEGPNGEEADFSCQLIYAGGSPYPSAPPAFPFDDQLDPIALQRGIAFASICRPPFQFAAAHSASFCQPCVDQTQCGVEDTCLMERGFAANPSGTCAQSCEGAADCPFGFSCDEIDGARFCAPIAGTCTRCLDEDGDRRGVGRCGSLSDPVTDIDCDDSDDAAFYANDNLQHPFPELCGDFDYNCNGISDRTEQLGSPEHCSDCGDVCRGRAGDIPNATRACVARNGGESYECVADCQQGFADCDGEIENGCEAELSADQLWFRDLDGDDRGNPTDFRFFCDGSVPEGWVQNDVDCDDENPQIYGGDAALAAAPELCDGLDNNCSGVADEPAALVGVDVDCNTGNFGVCGPGTTVCVDAGTANAAIVCEGFVNPADVEDVGETCDGRDNDCDGDVDEDVDYFADFGETNPEGYGAPVSCTVEDGLGICARGTFQCVADGAGGAGFECVGNSPAPIDYVDTDFVDSNCDGSDGNLSNAIFVRPVGGGGSLDGNDSNPGTANRPVATLQRAVALACASTGVDGCKDIYMASGEYPTTRAPRLPGIVPVGSRAPLRIYGGFNATLVNCETGTCSLRWIRGEGRSELIRQSPERQSGAYPFGRAYAGLRSDGFSSFGLSVLLHSLDIRVESPDATFLEDGQSAPDMVGLMCVGAGCRYLEFINTGIIVERALPGANATAAATAGFGAETRGRDGLTGGAAGPTYADRAAAEAALPGGEPAENCSISHNNRGGTSASYRWTNPDGGNRLYILSGRWGSGSGAGAGGAWITGGEAVGPRDAGRGTDGRGGNGAAMPGSLGYALTGNGLFGESTYSLRETTGRTSATNGRAGGGGGGGGGCLTPGNGAWSCPAGEVRGGTGGAGGCAGPAGGNGGDGGSTIGIWLLPRSSGSVELVAEPGELLVSLGTAGDGGRGADGSDGGPGGYGGRVASTASAYQGGNGGDGGAGGGGAGGVGGSSIGVVRHCPSGGCTFAIPPQMSADPASYLLLGTAGAAGEGGAGGDVGSKQPSPDHDDDVRTPSSVYGDAGDGEDGLAGFSQSFFNISGGR